MYLVFLFNATGQKRAVMSELSGGRRTGSCGGDATGSRHTDKQTATTQVLLFGSGVSNLQFKHKYVFQSSI
jgi:hypothetical protein